MEEKCIRCILQREVTKKGIKKYVNIMNLFSKVNISEDKNFQKTFTGFYRIRRNEQFRKEYYDLMQKYKFKNVSFEEILTELYKFGKLEASFTSKLIATIDHNLPIWNKYVLDYFNIEPPSREYTDKERIKLACNIYDRIQGEYKKIIETDNGKLMIKLFDEYNKRNNLSSVKKIDFIIWQSR